MHACVTANCYLQDAALVKIEEVITDAVLDSQDSFAAQLQLDSFLVDQSPLGTVRACGHLDTLPCTWS